jgi:TRAP-type C4-dicarboxylate transport system substrate-binding protein
MAAVGTRLIVADGHHGRTVASHNPVQRGTVGSRDDLDWRNPYRRAQNLTEGVTVKTNGWGRPVAMVAVFAAVLAGCADDEGSTKAGGGSPPVTLRIGTADQPGNPTEDQIRAFARHIEELSEGRLRIQPVFQAGGEANDDWDQVVGRMVMKGKLDMGLIPARAWDTEGVTSLRALQAPFLVTSDELVAEIVTSEVSANLLAGLDAINLTGLALLPEGLRHLFVFEDGAAEVFDLDGRVVRAPTSETTTALFTALGASTDDYPGAAFPDGVGDGTIHAAESEFALAGGTLPAPSTAVANLTLFPKVNSLVISTGTYEALGRDTQRVLREAAARTLDWAVSEMPSDADGAVVFCKGGGTVVNATAREVAATQKAVARVYQALERDETTKALIDRIRAIKAGLPPPPAIPSCEPAASTTGPSVASAESDFPDGVYRRELTADFLIEAGLDRATAVNHAGVWTLAFDNGSFTIEDTNASTGKISRSEGVYCIAEGRISLGIGLLGSSPTCGDFWSANWALDGDQLQFTEVRSGRGDDLLLASQFGEQPFTKIG